jgi:hypothetical protein
MKKNQFGKEVLKLCIDRDITLKDLSTKSGVCYATLLNSCTKEGPTTETVYKVSEGLGLSEAGARKLSRFARSPHTQSLSIGRVKMYGLSDGKRNAIIELCHLLRDTDETQIRKMICELKK